MYCWRSVPLPCGQYNGHFLSSASINPSSSLQYIAFSWWEFWPGGVLCLISQLTDASMPVHQSTISKRWRTVNNLWQTQRRILACLMSHSLLLLMLLLNLAHQAQVIADNVRSEGNDWYLLILPHINFLNKKVNDWKNHPYPLLQTVLPSEPYDEAAMADLYGQNKDRECKVWKIACRYSLD